VCRPPDGPDRIGNRHVHAADHIARLVGLSLSVPPSVVAAAPGDLCRDIVIHGRISHKRLAGTAAAVSPDPLCTGDLVVLKELGKRLLEEEIVGVQPARIHHEGTVLGGVFQILRHQAKFLPALDVGGIESVGGDGDVVDVIPVPVSQIGISPEVP